MPRLPRCDAEGVVVHAVNRGSARRTVAENRADFRYLLSRVAHAVRRGEFDVLAFTLLMTHFHLLLLSHGALSEGMRRVQNEHVREFNRRHKRDGPLFRGRFVSRRVRSVAHLYNVVRYIDENPVNAGLVRRPEEWVWGSAARFASGRPGPWLSTRAPEFLGLTYGGAAVPPPASIRAARAGFVEARLAGPESRGRDDLDDLLSGLPDPVRRWMLRKAQLADGTAPGAPVVSGERIQEILARRLAEDRGEIRLSGTRSHSMLRLLTVGLLRDAAGASFVEIARRVQRSSGNAKQIHALHRRAIVEDEAYLELATAIAQEAFEPLRVPPHRGGAWPFPRG